MKETQTRTRPASPTLSPEEVRELVHRMETVNGVVADAAARPAHYVAGTRIQTHGE